MYKMYDSSAQQGAANTVPGLTAIDLLEGRRAMQTLSANMEARKRASAIDPAELFDRHKSGASLKQLSAHYGLSVESIRQRLKKLGATPHPKGAPAETRVCADCGDEFRHFVSQDGGMRCKPCRGGNRWGKQGRTIEVNCAECGALLVRRVSWCAANGRNYCDRACVSAWRAKNGRGPEHPLWTGGPKAKAARIEACPKRRLRRRISHQIWDALKGGKLTRKWEALVGFNLDELKRHLERQFADGMTWENYGQWHIDHILPVSSFTFETAEDPDFKACFALTNLRPLWAVDNTRKGARRVLLL